MDCYDSERDRLPCSFSCRFSRPFRCAPSRRKPTPRPRKSSNAARTALGGGDALAKVQSATVTGSSRRIMGEREFSSDVTLDLLFPDKFKRTEEMSFGQGGPSVTRVSAVNGAEVWDDGTNRGGGGFMMRMGGPGGGPGGPGGPGGAGPRAHRGRAGALQAVSGAPHEGRARALLADLVPQERRAGDLRAASRKRPTARPTSSRSSRRARRR